MSFPFRNSSVCETKVVSRVIIFSSQPSEFMFSNMASHMISSFVLFNSCIAFRTSLYNIFLLEFRQTFILDSWAPLLFMPRLVAAYSKTVSTLSFSFMLSVRFSSENLDIFSSVCFWSPKERRISIYQILSFKFFI